MLGDSTGVRGVGIAVLLGAAVLGSSLVGPAGGTGGGAPLAEAGLDQQVLRGETVRLDGTGSYDPDGRVVAYEWRIETPGGLTVSPRGPRAARTSFPAIAVGRYEVTLTVTDDEGNTGTDTMYVRVGEPAAGPAGNGSDAGSDPGTGTGTGTGRRDGRVSGGKGSVTSEDPGTGTGAGTGTGSRDGSGGGADGATASAVTCSAGNGALGGGCPGSIEGSRSAPWVRIEGPTMVKAEHTYTYTATTGGLTDGRSYEWDGGDTGREHVLRFRSGGEYTTSVAVRDGNGRTATDRLRVFVARADNERPTVEIVDPGRIVPGERIRLSAEASDPDGEILTTEWSPDSRVRVPDDGSRLTVRVTVTDDDGASVTDVIALSGEERNLTAARTVDDVAADVTCYFTDQRQRDGPNPHSDRCVHENGSTVSLVNGPSRIESLRRKEEVDLQWRRVNASLLRSIDANDTSTDYGVAAGSPHDRADAYGYGEALVRRLEAGRWANAENAERFALRNRTVEDDLNGDGEVDAADWDQRYRTAGDTADVDPHADAAVEFGRAVRGDRDPDAGSVTLDFGGEATAETVEGRFAGTSIDEENRRDRVARLGRGDPTGASTGRDPDPATDRGSDSAGTGASDGDDPPDPARDANEDTSETRGGTAGDTGSAGGTGTSGSGSEGPGSDDGPSRHDPHGGRVVVQP